jgi:hypothetical protein
MGISATMMAVTPEHFLALQAAPNKYIFINLLSDIEYTIDGGAPRFKLYQGAQLCFEIVEQAVIHRHLPRLADFEPTQEVSPFFYGFGTVKYHPPERVVVFARDLAAISAAEYVQWWLELEYTLDDRPGRQVFPHEEEDAKKAFPYFQLMIGFLQQTADAGAYLLLYYD